MTDARYEQLPQTLNSMLRLRMNKITDALATGGAQDYGEYRYQCGMIHGLALAERELLDLQERLLRAD